jgi:uncharacterized protein
MKRFLALLACLFLLSSCGGDDGRPASEAVVHVGDASVTADVADDEPSRQRGLSGRDRLAPDAGMLFLLPTDAPRFWMKDMRFAIDIVWIKNGRVVDVTADVPAPAGPDAPLPTYSPERPANRALEVNAGWAAEHGVERGDPVRVRRASASG